MIGDCDRFGIRHAAKDRHFPLWINVGGYVINNLIAASFCEYVGRRPVNQPARTLFAVAFGTVIDVIFSARFQLRVMVLIPIAATGQGHDVNQTQNQYYSPERVLIYSTQSIL